MRLACLLLATALTGTAAPTFSQTLLLNDAMHPSFSPDGQEIVCGSRSADAILRLPVGGGSPDTLVAATGFGVGLPLWHQDGQHIVYERFVDGESDSTRIVVFDLNDQSEIAWPFHDAWDDLGFAISPDGSELLYSRNAAVETWGLNFETGQTRFVHNGHGGRISPDEQWIAFVNEQNEMIVEDLVGGTQHSFGVAAFPLWTSDAQWIVYSKLVGNGVSLYAAHPNGTADQEILSGGNESLFAGSIASQGSPLAAQELTLAYTKCANEFGPCDVWILRFVPTPVTVQQTSWGDAKSRYR